MYCAIASLLTTAGLVVLEYLTCSSRVWSEGVAHRTTVQDIDFFPAICVAKLESGSCSRESVGLT